MIHPNVTLAESLSRLDTAIDRDRLVETAVRLIEIPSPTGDAGAVSDRLAEMLAEEGFEVERPEGGYPRSPAVLVRLSTDTPGRTLQFNGHLDTVHLPFVKPEVRDGRITGSGASDMKGGVAAAIEALRALRDTNTLQAGSILLTAHDLHEAPWGDGRQLNQLIREGRHGDAVLLPEPLRDVLPIEGRGSATWKVQIRRPGPPVHEVMRPSHEPSVIAAAADLALRLERFGEILSTTVNPICGPPTVFIGQIHGGEIFNQYPRECWLEGTRRWLPGDDPVRVEAGFRALLDSLAAERNVEISCEWLLIRDAFHLDPDSPLITDFQACHSIISGEPLGLGPKPFVDDGNSFWSIAKIPAITHGPRAGGQHTVSEWVEIDDLVRVARLYAAIGVRYCSSSPPESR
jgi:acetylornithine deacetylase/succinyl-diaminopimelate desuccinylase-like protein